MEITTSATTATTTATFSNSTNDDGISAVVEYDYTANEPDELDLVRGAIIHNIKQMPGGWWEGTLQSSGRTGMFPDNFVRVVDINDDNTVILRDKSVSNVRRCKVIYSYSQVNDDELSLDVGDIIEFIDEVEEGWWRGRLRSRIGVFPSNFVKVIESSPVLATKRPPSLSTGPPAIISSNASTPNNILTKKSQRYGFYISKESLTDLNATTNATNATSTTTITANSNCVPQSADNSAAAPVLPPKPQRDYCRVEFPYAPQNDDELELKTDDIIAIHSMELPDKGWWRGELRGKVGVFPDNFVSLIPSMEVSQLNDGQQHLQPQQINRTSKMLNISSQSSNTSISPMSSTTSKSVTSKSSCNISTESSHGRDSFGSRDSLNDILSETGLPSGNVAAQRKSLENKNLDLVNASEASARLALKKQQLQLQQQQQHHHHYHHHYQQHQHQQQQQQQQQQHQQQQEVKNLTNSTAITPNASNNFANEMIKSMESVDEKTKVTPPAVLGKKPNIPSKKSTSVSSVAGNILMGLKQKVKNVESKLSSSVSHDAADGGTSSRSHNTSNGFGEFIIGSNIIMRRSGTLPSDEVLFDNVERSSILTDMRAGRVKAPKRRPPTAAVNILGNGEQNLPCLNGSGGGSGSETAASDDQLKSDDNSTSEELLAKPKPREWEKKRAPWMEELKASQVKKKTSPSVEGNAGGSIIDRTSKLYPEEIKNRNSINSTNSSSTTTKVQSSIITSSNSHQQPLTSLDINTSSNTTKSVTEVMTKSMSAKFVNDSTSNNYVSNLNASSEDTKTRPNSLSIRNRSLSPARTGSQRSNLKALSTNTSSASPAECSNKDSPAATAKSTLATINVINNSTHNNQMHKHPQQTQQQQQQQSSSHHHHQQRQLENSSSSQPAEGVRISELELRVEKLEKTVNEQQRTIEELLRTIREEADRVKILRSELDKYAQCVTQV